MKHLDLFAALTGNEDRNALASSEVFRNFIKILPEIEKIAEDDKKKEVPNPIMPNNQYDGQNFQDKVKEKTTEKEVKAAVDDKSYMDVVNEPEMTVNAEEGYYVPAFAEEGYYVPAFGTNVFIAASDEPEEIIAKFAAAEELSPEYRIKKLERELNLNTNTEYLKRNMVK